MEGSRDFVLLFARHNFRKSNVVIRCKYVYGNVAMAGVAVGFFPVVKQEVREKVYRRFTTKSLGFI